MTTQTYRPRAILSALTLALALTACGGSAPTAPAPAPTVITSPAPVVAANGHAVIERSAINSAQFTVTVPEVDAARGTPSLLLDGQVITSTSAPGSDGAIMLTQPNPLPDGTYHVAYSIADTQGRVVVTSAAITFTVDTVAPVLPSGGAAPAIMAGGVALPDHSTTAVNVPNVIVPSDAAALGIPTLIANGETVPSQSTALSGGAVSLTPKFVLPNGTYRLSFAITDAAGNTSVPSASTSITILATPPTVEGTPTVASGTTTNRMPSITVPAIDAGKGALGLLVDGQVVDSTAVPASGGRMTLTPLVALPPGSHQLAYRITNAAGTTSGVSPAVTVMVQAVNVLSGVGVKSTIASGEWATVTGTASSGHVTFTATSGRAGICTVTDDMVIGRTPGTCVITVTSPEGTGTDGQPYAAATPQTLTVTVTAQPHALRFIDFVTLTFRLRTVTVTAESDRQIPGVTYSAAPASVCTVDSATGQLTGVGSGLCTVTASIPTTVVNDVTFASTTGSKTVRVSEYSLIDFAGTGTAGSSGDGGPAATAKLATPYGVAVDAHGNVYIADTANHRIRKVTPGGVISTFAGRGTPGYSGDGGAATSAQLSAPYAVAVDTAGAVYITDVGNDVIRRVDPSGTITTIAGTGTAGYSGDGGPATLAQMQDATSIAVDGSGNIYFGMRNFGVIRKVDAAGTITTIAGTGTGGYSGDGGPATRAQLQRPYALCVDASGTVYVTDYGNSRVRRIDTTGIITTVAGTGTQGFSGDGGPAINAQLVLPTGITVAADGTLYVADAFNSRLRKIDPSSVITSITGSSYDSQLLNPSGLAVDAGGNLYIAEPDTSQVVKLAR